MALATTPALAQNLSQQQASQEARIHNGVASGQMTPGEANRMQVNEASIAREEANFRAQHGGRLTEYDRKRIEAREVKASNRVYGYKHNARTDTNHPG